MQAPGHGAHDAILTGGLKEASAQRSVPLYSSKSELAFAIQPLGDSALLN